MAKQSTPVSLSLMLLLSGSCLAQDAQQILQKVSDTYSGLKSYYFEGSTISENRIKGGSTQFEVGFAVGFTQPDKFRVEYRYPNAGNWVRVSDGKTFCNYRSEKKDLKQQPVSPADLSILRGTVISSFERLPESLNNPKVVRTENIEVGGRSIPCYVIEAERKAHSLLEGVEQLPIQLWIDKEHNIVLRQVTGTRSKASETENSRTVKFTQARIDEPQEDSLFALNPADRKP